MKQKENLTMETFREHKVVSILIIITFTYCFSPLIINHHRHTLDTDINNNQHLIVKPILASAGYSSFHPWVFRSGSGRLHLLFLHEIMDYDITIYKYYHTYELENGNWANAKKLDQVPLIFEVRPTKNGFTIYFGQNVEYESFHRGYSESHLFAGIFQMEYSENLDKWSDPVELFGESHTREYLKLSDQYFHAYLHSFFLQEDESAFVVWSFEFYGQDINFTHKDTKTYILSEISLNGVIDSHTIPGLEANYSNNQYVRIIAHDDSFYLYTLSYTKRAILFSNGTCSNWQDTPIPNDLATTFPLTTFTDHHLKKDWEVRKGQTISVIQKQYLVYFPMEIGWQILDLKSENLTVKSFIAPHNITPTSYWSGYNHTGHRTFDFERNHNSAIPEVFLTPIFTNSTIELWEFNYENASWKQVSSLNYNPSPHYDLLNEFPIIELLIDGNNSHIFWEQKVTNGVKPSHEIFTVMYNSTIDHWSSVIQVTDTETITDDEFFGDSSFGLLFVCTLIVFITTVLVLRRFDRFSSILRKK